MKLLNEHPADRYWEVLELYLEVGLYLEIMSHVWVTIAQLLWVCCATPELPVEAVAQLFEVVCATKATESGLLRRVSGGKAVEVGAAMTRKLCSGSETSQIRFVWEIFLY